MAAAAIAWVLVSFPVDKDAFIARLVLTFLFVEMHHSLNIRAVLSNLKALLFVGNIMFRQFAYFF